MKAKPPVPVTVLTGFLGAGKTTLLNYLLTQPHGYKCAIIINEYGSVSIDNQLVIGADEEIVELSNGCLCCRVRKDLIKALTDLVRKQKRFDYVLVETTGLADPGPVAQTFILPELRDHFRLDGIVTVVDAKNIHKELEDAPEASSQIAFADVLLLNKMDLVTPTQAITLEERLRLMNTLAKIYRTEKSQVDISKLFNISARALTAPLEIQEQVGETEEHDHDHDPHEQADHDHEHGHHDEHVRSFVISEERPLDMPKLETWLSELLSEQGGSIYRSKGILYVKGQAKRIVFQAVQMSYDAAPDRLWKVNEPKRSQMVFIGRDLDEQAIRDGFQSCLAP